MNIKNFLKKQKILYAIVTYIKWHERKKKFGNDNPGKIFYIIRRHDMHAGLFSFVMSNLGAIKECLNKKYIPVIDMMNSPNSMLGSEETGKRNAWEDYFEQPCGYALNDISKSAHVIMGSIQTPEIYPDETMLTDAKVLHEWQQLSEKYIRLLPEHEQQIDNYIEEIFLGRRVLGVLCRGTDYLSLKPKGHPIQPNPADVIKKCHEVMQKYHCEIIYLATEDEDIWSIFEKEFQGKVFSYQKNRISLHQAQYLDDIANQMQTPYERTRQYLVSVGILARCNCLVAGAVNGTYGALLLTKGYEYQYIYKLGRYE